ncbi:MAG: VanZ family protein [Verrucomicrobiota bacterium]|nr:VanZ family protein [Verrucomicrobiota bacterium]
MPVLAWMLVIFGASTDLGSAEHTSRFLIPFLHWIHPQISPASIAVVELMVRKAAHLTEYAILAVLLLRALRANARMSLGRAAAAVLLAAGLYAMTDEFHQSFSPARTPAWRDVMIDCAGATLGLAVSWLVTSRSTKRKLAQARE